MREDKIFAEKENNLGQPKNEYDQLPWNGGGIF